MMRGESLARWAVAIVYLSGLCRHISSVSDASRETGVNNPTTVHLPNKNEKTRTHEDILSPRRDEHRDIKTQLAAILWRGFEATNFMGCAAHRPNSA